MGGGEVTGEGGGGEEGEATIITRGFSLKVPKAKGWGGVWF